jgi:hypothetical protein
LCHQGWGNRQFRLRFRDGRSHDHRLDRFMGQRHPGRVADRRQHIDRATRLAVLELAAERLAIQTDAEWGGGVAHRPREVGRERAGQRIDVQPHEQALQR